MAKIVVADADPETIPFFSEYLTKRGHQMLTSDDAYAAATLAELQGSKLVIVAAQVAGGGCFKTLEWLRAKPLTRETALLVLTSIFEPSSAEITEGPLVRVMEKPLKPELLDALLNEFFPPPPPQRVASPEPVEDDLAPLGPPPGAALKPPPMDMGAPSDEELPAGDVIDLDL